MGNPLKPISASASLTLDFKTHSGSTVVMTSVGPWTVTLPEATGLGARYSVFLATTVTTSCVIAAPGADILQGAIALTTDAAGVTVPTLADSDKMTLNGGTTGGFKGSRVDLLDVASGIWAVSGFVLSSGAEATPFSSS